MFRGSATLAATVQMRATWRAATANIRFVVSKIVVRSLFQMPAEQLSWKQTQYNFDNQYRTFSYLEFHVPLFASQFELTNYRPFDIASPNNRLSTLLGILRGICGNSNQGLKHITKIEKMFS
jgi:hypothetical protein